MNASLPVELLRKARRRLSRDPVMKAMMAHVGPCTLQPGGEPFEVLVRSVVAQLISTAAARTIYARLETLVGAAGVTPTSILALDQESLRRVGLSTTKTLAIRDLASRASDGRLPLTELPTMSDEAILTALTEVRGIGVWTAEMFLIFCLGRLDVLPVSDFGLRAGVQQWYELDALPRPSQLRQIALAWQPYRSIATWYVWRSRGFVPQSL
jgi:DNA-3-methyladenine glycosylase II